MTDFVKIIKHKLKEYGMTQKQLSQATGIPEPNISHWFHHVNDPTLQPLDIVAHELGMRLALVDEKTGKEVKL